MKMMLIVILLTGLKAADVPAADRWTGLVQTANASYEAGRFRDAVAGFRAALPEAASLPEKDLRRAITHYMLASSYLRADELLNAEAAYKLAWSLWQDIAPNDPERANVCMGLSELYRRMGHLAKAERYAADAIAIREMGNGPDWPGLAGPLQNLAALYWIAGRTQEAERLLRRTPAMADDSAPAAVVARGNLALMLAQRGALDEALREAQRAVEISRAAQERGHPDTARAIAILAFIHSRRQHWREAEALVLEALGLIELAPGCSSELRESIFRTYSEVLKHTGRKAEARRATESADAVRRSFRRDNGIGAMLDAGALVHGINGH